MALEQFNLLKSPDKRLIHHDGVVYKIQIIYASSEELQKLPCTEEIAHKEIENVIKACVYSARKHSSQNIQTSHFKISCAFKEWGAGRKLKFIQNGIEMKAHSHMLVIKVEPLDREFIKPVSSANKRMYVEDGDSPQKSPRKSPRISNTQSNNDKTNVRCDKVSDQGNKRRVAHIPSQQLLNSSTEQYPLQYISCERSKETNSSLRTEKSSHTFRLKEVCLDNKNTNSSCKKKIVFPDGDNKRKRKRSDRPKKHDVQTSKGRENMPSCTIVETNSSSAVCDVHLGDSNLNIKDNDQKISVDELGHKAKRSFISSALSVFVTPVKKLFGK